MDNITKSPLVLVKELTSRVEALETQITYLTTDLSEVTKQNIAYVILQEQIKSLEMKVNTI